MRTAEFIYKLKQPKPGLNMHGIVMSDIPLGYVVDLLKLPKDTPLIDICNMSGLFERRLTSALLSLVDEDVLSQSKGLLFNMLDKLLRKMKEDESVDNSGVKFPIPPLAASILMHFMQIDDKFPRNIVIKVPNTDLSYVLYRILVNMIDYYQDDLKPINVILVFEEDSYVWPGLDVLHVFDVPRLKFIKYAPFNLYKVAEGKPFLAAIYAKARKYPDIMKQLAGQEFLLYLLLLLMYDKYALHMMLDYLESIGKDISKIREAAKFIGIVDEDDNILGYTFVAKMLEKMPKEVVDEFVQYANVVGKNLPVSRRPEFWDAVANALYAVGDVRYVGIREWNMRLFRNLGEYTLAIHRGILVLNAGKKRNPRVIIEMERLVNMQRYLPPEFQVWENKVYSAKSPLLAFHYYWLKHVYFDEIEDISIGYRKIWKELGERIPLPRYAYILALLITLDRANKNITDETAEIVKVLEKTMETLEQMEYVARDILVFGYLALALYYSEENLRTKTLATYRKLVVVARNKEVYIVEGIAHNNIGYELSKEDLPLRTFERFYALGNVSLLKAGGASRLFSVGMLNYLSTINAYKKKDEMDILFDSFYWFVYPKTIERNRVDFCLAKAYYLLRHGYVDEAIYMEKTWVRGKPLFPSAYLEYAYFLIELAYETGDNSYLDVIPDFFTSIGKRLEDYPDVYLLIRALKGDERILDEIKVRKDLTDIDKAEILRFYFIKKGELIRAIVYLKRLLNYSVKIGNLLSVARLEREYGLIYKDLGRFYVAYEHLRKSYELYKYLNSEKMIGVLEKELSEMGDFKKQSFVLDEMIFEMFTQTVINIAVLSSPDRLFADLLDSLIHLTPAYRGIIGIYSKVRGWVDYAARDIEGNIDILPNVFDINWDIIPEHAWIYDNAKKLTVISEYKSNYVVIHLEDPYYEGRFEERDRLVVEYMAKIVPSIIENMELKRRSLFDSLTGLYNRWYLLRRMEDLVLEAKREDTNVSIIFIDVDNFKQVNDTYGHDVGDRLLRKIADVIRSSLRSTDVVGRYGGDEIVVVMKHASLNDTVRIAERIRRSIEEMKKNYPEASLVSVSLGIASSEIIGYDPLMLLKAADSAMYKAKELGKNRIYIAH